MAENETTNAKSFLWGAAQWFILWVITDAVVWYFYPNDNIRIQVITWPLGSVAFACLAGYIYYFHLPIVRKGMDRERSDEGSPLLAQVIAFSYFAMMIWPILRVSDPHWLSRQFWTACVPATALGIRIPMYLDQYIKDAKRRRL